MVLMNAVGSDRHGCILLFYISNPISLQQHDVQLDYYGKRLATCSSDRIIKIFDVTPDQTQHQLSAHFQAHEGPVWQVAWAHPKFGRSLNPKP